MENFNEMDSKSCSNDHPYISDLEQCPYCSNSNTSNESPSTKKNAPYATVVLVCSIIGIVLFLMLVFSGQYLDNHFDTYNERAWAMSAWAFFTIPGILLSILGMVLGIKGYKKTKTNRNSYSNYPMLVVGKVLSIIGVSIWGIFLVLGLVVILCK